MVIGVFRVASRTCSIQPENFEEQHVRCVFFTFCSGTDRRNDGQGCDCGPPKLTGTFSAARPRKKTLLQLLVSVGGSSGSRDVIHPISGGGLLGERPVVAGGRERTAREEQLQRQIESDTAQGPVVKAKRAPSASLVERDGHLEGGPAEYRGWCPFCIACKGKSEAHRWMEAPRDHAHPELHLDYPYVGGEAEDRASPILVGKVSRDGWLVTHLVPCKRTQHPWIDGKLVNVVTTSFV